MHTLSLIAAGLALLAIFVLVGRRLKRPLGLQVYLLIWGAVCVVNLLVGTLWAGYSLAAELAVLLVVFAVPAAAAYLVLRRSR